MLPKSVLITVRTADDDWMLLRVSVICHMRNKRAERLDAPPARAAPAYVSLEPKLCESCSKSFLRVIGEEEKLCSGCEEKLAAAAVAHEASLAAAKRGAPERRAVVKHMPIVQRERQGRGRGRPLAQGARIRAAARG
jgi:hypothetical protein